MSLLLTCLSLFTSKENPQNIPSLVNYRYIFINLHILNNPHDMKHWISLFILIALPLSVLSLNCNKIQNSQFCTQLSGCSWTDNNCVGDISHTCNTAPECYYIDPIDGLDTQSGLIQDPFQTLNPAFQFIQEKDATIFIINPESDIQVQILSLITIDSNIAIRPLFEGNNYIISLEKFNPADHLTAIDIRAGKLEISNAIFDQTSSIETLETIFSLGDAQLSFQNVSILNQNTPKNIVRSTAIMSKLSQFNFIQGQHINSSSTFVLQGGLHSIANVIFLDNHAPQALITLNKSSLDISNTSIQKGESLLIQAENRSTLRVENLIFKDYNGNFLRADDPYLIVIIASTFRDLNIDQSSPFIHITGKTLSYSYIHYIENTIFQDINLQASLFLVDKAISTIHLSGVNMTNINKIVVPERSLPEDFSRAICFVASQDISVTIEKSNFINIASNCIFLDSSALVLTENIFNNTALDLPSESQDSQGISWVSFHDGTNNINPGFLVSITENQFIENKMPPLKGGALKITGKYPVQFEIKENIFIKNKALVSGGAIYSENVYSSFKIENGEFSENSAKIGGAIHTINEEVDKDEKKYRVQLKGVKFTKNRFSAGSILEIRDDKLDQENVLFEDNVQEIVNGGRRGISFDEL